MIKLWWAGKIRLVSTFLTSKRRTKRNRNASSLTVAVVVNASARPQIRGESVKPFLGKKRRLELTGQFDS